MSRFKDTLIARKVFDKNETLYLCECSKTGDYYITHNFGDDNITWVNKQWIRTVFEFNIDWWENGNE